MSEEELNAGESGNYIKSSATSGAKKDKKAKQGGLDELLDWVKSLTITFIAVVLIFTFVARTAIVNGDSMLDTLHHNDFLILWSLFYTPKQGDIISANCDGLNEVIVKRIIAVGGQEVDINFDTGEVFVDGELLDEPYIRNLTINDEGAFDYPIVVEDGYYFCMGDNRQGSRDSRDPAVGLIAREDILGKVVMRVYPFNRIRFF